MKFWTKTLNFQVIFLPDYHLFVLYFGNAGEYKCIWFQCVGSPRHPGAPGSDEVEKCCLKSEILAENSKFQIYFTWSLLFVL